ncbi:DNA maturase B, partial [Klebsiella pneumoniae]
MISFDVGPAKPDHSPSVKSVGITGQLTGSRADIIIADDVEIPGNPATQGAREKLWTLVQEFA